MATSTFVDTARYVTCVMCSLREDCMLKKEPTELQVCFCTQEMLEKAPAWRWSKFAPKDTEERASEE